MYSYANIVRSTLNQEKPEIMMQFLQAAPKYKENSTTVIGTDVEVVASVVMNSDAARGFAKSILDLLDDENGAGDDLHADDHWTDRGPSGAAGEHQDDKI